MMSARATDDNDNQDNDSQDDDSHDDSPEIFLHGKHGKLLMRQLKCATRVVLSQLSPVLANGGFVTPHALDLCIFFFKSTPHMLDVNVEQNGSVIVTLSGALLAPFIFTGYRFVSMLTDRGVTVNVERTAERITPTQHLQCFLIDFMPLLHQRVCARCGVSDEAYTMMFSTQNANVFRMHALGARLPDVCLPLASALVTKPILSAHDLFASPASSVATVVTAGATTTTGGAKTVPLAAGVVPAAANSPSQMQSPATVLAAIEAAKKRKIDEALH